jgi:L-histidine Nalpha-methyltransferase
VGWATEVPTTTPSGLETSTLLAASFARLRRPQVHRARLAADVARGLSRRRRELPSKCLHDARSSALFARICELDEYYPARVERRLLDRLFTNAKGLDVELVELGPGTREKTVVLLDGFAARGPLSRYLPFDVSEQALTELSARLAASHPGLHVVTILGDLDHDITLIPPPESARVVAFLGGTYGNYQPRRRRQLLCEIASLLDGDGELVLGVALEADPVRMVAAYADAHGVTAAFNRNILDFINDELGGDFDRASFAHEAVYDPSVKWIEMRLVALRDCHVQVRDIGATFDVAKGESIRTEISARFTRRVLERELAQSGLTLCGWLEDDEGLFALASARPHSPVQPNGAERV